MYNKNILALSGGVGGAKLALGLSQVLPAEQLTVVANTADDFEHLGLHIAPDLDTVMYTLAGISNREQGWGLADESWQCMQAIRRLGGESWFQLGDQDLATHLLRSQWLAAGDNLTTVTDRLCQRLSVRYRILPMCNEKVSTLVHSPAGDLPFQHYFVREQCRPEVSGFSFRGIENSRLSSQLSAAIEAMGALIVCPSNPFVSIAPILAVNSLKQTIIARNTPRIVVSPIVSGMAIKGPAGKMMQELSMPVTALSVAEYYRQFATHFVLDSADSHYRQAIEALGMEVIICNTVMHSLDERISLAKTLLDSSALQGD